MANSKISALTSATTPLAGTETLPIVQSSATTKVTVANLTAGRSVSVGNLTVTTSATAALGSANINASAPTLRYKVTSGTADKNTYEFRAIAAGVGADYFQIRKINDAQTVFTELFQITNDGNIVPSIAAKGINFTANTPASGMTSQLLNWYDEGAWTPVPTSLTVVGTPTYTGKWTRIGREVFIHLTVKSTTSTASTANTTYFSGLPYAVGLGSTVSAVNNATVASLGIGLIDTSNVIYTPSWTSGANQTITLSGFYYV